MPVNPNIPLSVNTLDTANPLARLADTRMAQEDQAYNRGIQQNQLQRQAMLDERAMKSQALQDDLVRKQLINAEFKNMDAREQSRINSVVNAAVMAKRFVDAGDFEGLKNAALQRKQELTQMMQQGQQVDTEDTDAILGLLEQGKTDQVKQLIDGTVQSGQLLGLVKSPTETGGAMGSMIARLQQENPGMSTADAMAIYRGGGSVDPETGEVRNPTKPLSATEVKLQNEALSDLAIANNIETDLGAIQSQIESGALPLGPVSNAAGRVRNYLGVSDKESRNLATFESTLEKLRNDSLRLNNGVQTEGDAQRAWNELFKNVNDPQVVAQRLAEIRAINRRAADLKKLEVENIRSNKGQSSIDYSKYEMPAAVGQDQQPQQGAIKFLGFE